MYFDLNTLKGAKEKIEVLEKICREQANKLHRKNIQIKNLKEKINKINVALNVNFSSVKAINEIQKIV